MQLMLRSMQLLLLLHLSQTVLWAAGSLHL
jgi:hypothetical protein